VLSDPPWLEYIRVAGCPTHMHSLLACNQLREGGGKSTIPGSMMALGEVCEAETKQY
jgi:hypothetical protein